MEQEVKRGKSFLREAAVLTVSNFAVKIIGVVFKIPLTNILGQSIGVFNAAYSIYAMLFMLSTSGLPVAISRLVAASNERGRGREADRISLLSGIAFGLVGLFFTVLLLVLAPFVAKVTGHPDSATAMRVIAPSLLFICICSSERGYYQGLHNMVPTAVSQFIEAFFKMSVGLAAVYIAASRGASVPVQAACAISGVSVGEFFAMAYILVVRKLPHRSRPDYTDDTVRPDKTLIRAITLVALPVTLTAAALYFSQFLDTLIIVNVLESSGETHETAHTLYSAYTGLSVPLYDLLPATLVFPIATSILPAISGARAVGQNKRAAKLTAQAIRLSGIIAVPCGVFLLVTGKWCISLLYGADKWNVPLQMASGAQMTALDSATYALSVLSFAVFFISIVSTTNSLLNAYGRQHLPFISVLIGIGVLTVVEIGLLYSPLGIIGAAASSLVCYMLVTLLNIHFLRKYCGVRLRLAGMFARPVLCGAVTALFVWLARLGATALWKNLVSQETLTRGASLFILVISGIVLVAVYCVTVIAFRAIKEDEIRLLPKGDKIADLLIKHNIIKQAGVK